MELNRISLPPLTTPGAVITCYAYEGGATRSTVVAALAHALAGRAQAGTPVLMIDWDMEAPGLDRLFEAPAGLQGGILELFSAYREALARPGPDPETRARHALEAVPWQDYLVRVDQTRPLYLLRAGRLDASFGERAAAFSWSALHRLCPPLFRQFAAMLAARFRYVLIDARGGRSEQVSVCTTFLPDRLLAMFSPCQRSLDGTAGVVQRALDYRRSHEEEQRPLVVYPVPLGVDAEHGARRARWRWGEPDQPGYQSVFGHLLGDGYGYEQLSLDSYFDEVLLPHAAAFPEGPDRADRLSARRACASLLEWLADGYFPWQSLPELRLLRRLAAARLADGDLAGEARLLYRLGCCHAAEQHPRQACAAFDAAIALFQRTLGDAHPATRQARAQLAGLMLELGKLAEARFLYELLLEDSAAQELRLGLARTLSCQGEHEAALALLAELVAEEGDGQPHFTAQLALADALARQGELTRARMLYERVLEGRQRLLGEAHEESLACMRRLAALLSQLGDLFNARRLQESLLALRLRHAGAASAAAARERALLAEILAMQGELAGAPHPPEAGPALAPGADSGLGGPQVALGARGLHEAVLSAGRLGARSDGPHGPVTGPAGAPARLPPSQLEREVMRLRRLLDGHDLPAARTSADNLRAALRQSGLGDPLRRSGSQLVKRTYQLLGDKDALVAFQEEELRVLEGALVEAQGPSG